MSFAKLIPNWNSLESVRRVHSDLEGAALAFFALLVLFDILAHLSIDEARKKLLEKIGLGFFAVAVLSEIVAWPYGQRNDTLSAQTIGSLSIEVDKAADEAAAVSKNAGALDKRINLASLRLSEFEAGVLPKELTEADRREIINACRPFANSGVKIELEGSEGYGFFLASQIDSALANGAGFNTSLVRSNAVWYGIQMGGLRTIGTRPLQSLEPSERPCIRTV